MGKLKRWTDGLNDFLSSLTNRRNASARNNFVSDSLSLQELRAIYKSGTANKIFRIKTGAALSDTIIFFSEEDKEIYKAKVSKAVKKACMYQLGFGRGIVVIHENGAVLDQPLRDGWNKSKYKLDVFSGDEITATQVEQDLQSPRFYKPEYYVVRGYNIHWTRVADFTYIEPILQEAPNYRYGGISESEIIYDQLVNDGIIQRASASIIEKNSNLFYKIKDFKSIMSQGKESNLLKYISTMENHRSIYGAGIVDMDDDVFNVSQTLTNLKEIDDVSLRRLSLVTGIPVSWLVGENVKGLNSSGENELKIFNDMVKTYQEFYIIDTLNELLHKLGLNHVKFKDTQAGTPLEDANYEKVVIGNAFQLAQMGEDFDTYLKEKDIIRDNDNVDSFFDCDLGDDE